MATASVNTVDVIAIQRFFLGLTTGIANVGKYQFTPANRTYPGIVTNQTAQNYDTLVFGDVASSFVELVDGPKKGGGAAGIFFFFAQEGVVYYNSFFFYYESSQLIFATQKNALIFPSPGHFRRTHNP